MSGLSYEEELIGENACLCAEIASLKAQLAEALAWRPIETAKPENCIVAAWYWHSKSWIVGEAHWIETSPSEEGWWWWANIDPYGYHGENIFNMGGKPMLWQPLPMPPNGDPEAVADLRKAREVMK